MAQETDKELVRRVKRGDRVAFDLLFTRYQHKIHSLVGRYVRDPDEALDVAQEAFIKAWRALPQFRGDSQFYTWLYRIAVNCAKNHLVARDRRPPNLDFDIDDEGVGATPDQLQDLDDPESLLARDELQFQVWRGPEHSAPMPALFHRIKSKNPAFSMRRQALALIRLVFFPT